jgi:hypothetical protein
MGRIAQSMENRGYMGNGQFLGKNYFWKLWRMENPRVRKL